MDVLQFVGVKGMLAEQQVVAVVVQMGLYGQRLLSSIYLRAYLHYVSICFLGGCGTSLGGMVAEKQAACELWRQVDL